MFKNHGAKSLADSRLKIGYVTERTVTRFRAKIRDKNSLQSHRTNDFYDRFINSFETQHRLEASRHVRVRVKSSWPVDAMATAFYNS